MKVLVTGVTGRVGANLAKALLEEGYQVRGLVWPEDPRTGKLKGLNVEFVYGDLRNYEDLEEAAKGVDAVCHLGAAFTPLLGRTYAPSDYFEVNVAGLFKFLEAILKVAPNLQRFVFSSSDAIYDKYPLGGVAEPIQESFPVRPRGWYSISKYLCEEMLWAYHRQHHLPVVSLRYAFIVGAGEILTEGMSRFFSLKSWLERLRGSRGRGGAPEQEALEILETLWEGEERLLIARMLDGRSYKKGVADVRDIVRANVLAVKNEEGIGEAMHISSPAFTWAEAVPYLSDKLDIPYVEARLPTTPTYYEFDLSKAKRLIHYEPRYDIFAMIDSALALRDGKDIGIIPT